MWTNRDRARNPSGIYCSARSRASPLQPRQLLAMHAPGLLELDAAADEHFLFRMVRDDEAGAAQHGFGGGTIRNPPVRRIACIAALHEMQAGVVEAFEDRRFSKWIILRK